MTIKKQTNFLIIFIAAIPVFCLIYIGLHQYFTSNSRFLMNGSQKIENFDEKNFSHKDRDELFSTLRLLPPSIQTCVISNDNTIIYSTIEELKINSSFHQNELWHFVRSTSDKYFYQFTNVNLTTTRVTLITRISRSKQDITKHKSIILSIFILVTVLVLICVIFVTLIFHNIFKSLLLIKNTTAQLAEGNLSTKIITDESNIKENEITSTLLSLEKMRISLLEEQNRKNKFIMGISHDLRTPVSIIKGYIEAISDGVITEKKELTNALELILNKTNQLDDMIDSLINFMKLNKNDIKDTLYPTSITKIIENFAKKCEISANVFKRTIITNINIEDIEVNLNEQLLLRALENLFSNALRYTKDGDKIEINSYTKDNFLYLEIKDSGLGIAEKDLKYIFDMFYRGTNSRHEDGMGIGLAVVQNIISIHEWKISVESHSGEGSCFRIEIPISD